MAHESFEDEDVAARLNERFVNVKVDREERPDVDAVYMEATTALTGHGGWPMSVFLTPDGRPFFAGTYWPKDDRAGMPGFVRVIDSVWEAWSERRDEVESSAEQIRDAIAARTRGNARASVDPGAADRAAGLALQHWDQRLGGFGRAPKFPQAMTLEWLLDRHLREGDEDALTCVLHSLDAMARGGIHDQVGGGFHRYSTDARWLAPHFEKMLYDNALLAPVFAKAAALTGDDDLDRVARSTLDYLLSEMRDGAGGFWSATDADVEGEEGKFFVWRYEEFAEVVRSVGADVDRFAAFYGVSPTGNWSDPHEPDEAKNILHEQVDRRRFCKERSLDLEDFTAELDRVREALYARRDQRTHPGLDDKVLCSWNALAVRALVLTGMHLDLPEYVAAAVETATFLHEEMVVDGRLHHVWKEGEASVPAFLEDLSYLAIACLDLYAATGDVVWFERARQHASDARQRFRDDENGGFFETADDAEELYTRPKSTWDNATPSGNSVMAEVAMRIGAYTGDAEWRETAEEILGAFQTDAEQAPTGFGWLLRVAEQLAAGPREVAIVGRPGPDRDALITEVWRPPRTGVVVAIAEPDGGASSDIPLLEGRGEVDGRPAAYVCREFVCQRPVTDASELRALIAGS
jgi:uncharacterized protein